MKLKPKVRIKRGKLGTAIFSRSMKYRYVLERDLRDDESQKIRPLVVIGLNPSKADHQQNDNTVSKCQTYARRFGCTYLYMLNAFAIRATDPKKMMRSRKPIGLLNTSYIEKVVREANKLPGCIILLAWGNHAIHMNRARTLRKLLADYPLYCFGVTNAKQPKHPLYLKNDCTLYRIPRREKRIRILRPVNIVSCGHRNCAKTFVPIVNKSDIAFCSTKCSNRERALREYSQRHKRPSNRIQKRSGIPDRRNADGINKRLIDAALRNWEVRAIHEERLTEIEKDNRRWVI